MSNSMRLLGFLAFFLLPFMAAAQESRGSIQGRVFDATEAVIPNAAIVATNLATNSKVQGSSNAEGFYNLLYLLPGDYALTATAAGFKAFRSENVVVRIHDRLQIDIRLEVGDVSQQVAVTARSSLLETASANLGQVVDARLMAELPIPHGSPFSLIYLLPGVAMEGPNSMTVQEPMHLQTIVTRTNISGAPRGTSDYTVDGVPNSQTSQANSGSGPSNSPPADLVQEFKLETAYDASVGHTSGAVINFSLKTGTNQPHGTAYYYHRDPAWTANQFFANRSGQPRGDFTYKRWGGSFTGPLYIPKVYNGRERTFFSYGYEGLHENERSTGLTATVPDAKQLTGDFSGLLAVGSQYKIYDPATIRPAASGRFSIQEFPNNVIPSARISPIGKNMAAHYPKPNAAGRADGVNNFVVANNLDPRTYYNHIVRIDHNISDRQRFYGRVAINRRTDGPYRKYWDDPVVGQVSLGPTRQAAIDDVYTVSPSLVLNARYGYNRYYRDTLPDSYGFDVSSLGFPRETAALLTETIKIFPTTSVSGLPSLSSEGANRDYCDTHSAFLSVAKQQGAHGLKIGADARSYRKNGADAMQQAAGSFSFATAFTQGPLDNSPSSPGGIGQGLAALLLGQPTGGSIARNASQAATSTYWALYFHDNWRVNSKLTLDLGIRWEYQGPVTERFNRAVRGFDATTAQSIEAQAKARYAANPDAALPASQFQLRGGLMFAGVGGQPRGFWDRSFVDFAPRVGAALQLLPRFVVRSGFGVYPIQFGVPLQNVAIQSGFTQSTTMVPTLNNGQTFIGTLAQPYPNGLLNPPGASLGIATFLGQSVSFYNPRARTPYSMRWSFNTQTLLPGDILLETGYVGSKAIRLLVNREMDAVPNQYLSTSPVRDQRTIDFLSANVSNPMAGLLPGTSLNGNTITRSRLLVPMPQFSSVTMTDYQGYSWYHSLQTRIERRFRHGFSVLGAYTFAKTMEAVSYLNAADPRPSQVISTMDRPHSLAFSGIFELPFGRGRPLLSGLNRLADSVIGGWQLGVVRKWTSGAPVAFGNIAFIGDIKDIPLPADRRSIDKWFNTEAGFERNSSRQLASNLRTFPLRLAGVRYDAYSDWDLSLLKKTRIREGYQAEFRAEFLNAFNHPSAFSAPNASPTSSAFGTVTAINSLPRIIQLGMKLVF